jgi:hypothetical protein
MQQVPWSAVKHHVWWGAGELVIVDVNYFPSFKGIPEAAAALQAALRERYAAHAAGASASPHHA